MAKKRHLITAISAAVIILLGLLLHVYGPDFLEGIKHMHGG